MIHARITLGFFRLSEIGTEAEDGGRDQRGGRRERPGSTVDSKAETEEKGKKGEACNVWHWG